MDHCWYGNNFTNVDFGKQMDIGSQINEKLGRFLSNSVYYGPHNMLYKVIKKPLSDLAWEDIRDGVESSIEIWEGVESSIQTYIYELKWR